MTKWQCGLYLKLVYDEAVVEQHRHDGDHAQFAEQRHDDRPREPVFAHRRYPTKPIRDIVRRHFRPLTETIYTRQRQLSAAEFLAQICRPEKLLFSRCQPRRTNQSICRVSL